MSILADKNRVKVRFSNLSDGANTSEDSTAIGKRQVQDCKNAILRKNGISRRPGSLAKGSFNLMSLVEGLHSYLDFTSTERLLMGAGGKLYDINKTNGTPTEKYDLTGLGNFYFADALGKCFSTNGTEVVKTEGATTYQLGIDAPTGASAAATTSVTGTLDPGSYEVYISYGRDIDGTIVLYSTGEYLGSITVTAPDQSITISDFDESADPQVNKKVIWMTDADGTPVYRYLTAANDATTTYEVNNADEKQVSILYSTWAASNADVPDFEYILTADGRLWGSVGNQLYYSLKNTLNSFDLERFFPLNKIGYDFESTGLFSVQGNLYVNTENGIYRQRNADVNARTEHVEKRWNFKYMNTVADYASGKIGLTNDGVKFFDGDKFLDYDISEDVKEEISKMYITTTGFEPYGYIYRRGIRTEYHLCYNDPLLSTNTNNKRIVLNLDKLAYLPEKKVVAPWEIWSNGATHVAVDCAGIAYQAQSHATLPQLYIEDTNTTIDNGIYLDDGTVGDGTSTIDMYVLSRTELVDMSARIQWHTLRTMARLSGTATITIVMRDVEGVQSSLGIASGEDVFLWDVGKWDESLWASSTPKLRKTKIPRTMKGYMMYIRVEQKANDPDFNMMDIVIEGIASQTRFT